MISKIHWLTEIIMNHPKKQVAMSTKVKIIYVWLFIMFAICGSGIWIFTTNLFLGLIIVICDAVSLLFWVIYVIKNWKCPHCGHDIPGLYYCKYCGKSLDEEK